MRIEAIPEQHASMLVVGVGWIRMSVNETFVRLNSAAVLGRATPLSSKANRMVVDRRVRQDVFKYDLVFPAVAEIVLVQEQRL